MGKALLWENSIGREQLLGAGVSVPGPVDREKGVSTHAYRIWNQSVQVASLLAQALECTILLENNVKAFARAELTYGLGRTQGEPAAAEVGSRRWLCDHCTGAHL